MLKMLHEILLGAKVKSNSPGNNVLDQGTIVAVFVNNLGELQIIVKCSKGLLHKGTLDGIVVIDIPT